jgi:ELWxxDGT repeat protein
MEHTEQSCGQRRNTTGTSMVADIDPGATSSSPHNFQTLNGVVYFIANNSKLWRSNGTAAGTSLVKDFGTSIVQIQANDGALFVWAGMICGGATAPAPERNCSPVRAAGSAAPWCHPARWSFSPPSMRRPALKCGSAMEPPPAHT